MFEPPGDLDLAAEWRATAAEVDGHRSAVRATVRVPARLAARPAHALRHLPRRDVAAPPPAGPEGTATVRVGAHLVRGLAEQLAGFGAAVEVLDHAGLRAELAAIGAELLEAHGP